MKKVALFAVVALASLSLLVGCSKTPSDPGDAMITHMSAMFKIIKDNKEDCDKVASALEAYSSKHKQEIEKLVKAGKEMEAKMSDTEKKEYEEKMMKKMEPFIAETMTVMMEISQKCPEHMAKISAAMGDMK